MSRVERHPAAAALELRRELRQRIVAGDVEAAQKLLEQHCPRLLDVPEEPSSGAEAEAGGGGATAEGWELAVGLRVSCQQFIELIRRGQLEEAVTFGQQVWILNSEIPKLRSSELNHRFLNSWMVALAVKPSGPSIKPS